jgi:ketosteroid isomerase-like protein
MYPVSFATVSFVQFVCTQSRDRFGGCPCIVLAMSGEGTDDHEALAAANARFYEAFEQRDFDAMSDMWVHDDRSSCTHPGWPTLKGWSSVVSSWATLLANTQRLQFILTNVRVHVHGDCGWVTCDENILDTSESSTVAACKVFVRNDANAPWKLVVHHGSVVHASIGSMG